MSKSKRRQKTDGTPSEASFLSRPAVTAAKKHGGQGICVPHPTKKTFAVFLLVSLGIQEKKVQQAAEEEEAYGGRQSLLLLR